MYPVLLPIPISNPHPLWRHLTHRNARLNSYIKKYEFISPVTYELLHMNSYVSDPYK